MACTDTRTHTNTQTDIQTDRQTDDFYFLLQCKALPLFRHVVRKQLSMSSKNDFPLISNLKCKQNYNVDDVIVVGRRQNAQELSPMLLKRKGMSERDRTAGNNTNVCCYSRRRYIR